MMFSRCSNELEVSGVGSVRSVLRIFVHLMPVVEEGNFMSGMSEHSGSSSFLSFFIFSLA